MTMKTYLLPPEQIERNLSDLYPSFSKGEALLEAERCLYCYDAPCTRACPTHIDVPSFIKKIASGNLIGSARVIFDANPIGLTCARVCPTSDLCEGACVEKTAVHLPIQIGRLQRYATEHALASGREIFAAAPANGFSVGVVGAGPAGLSCAQYLARMGYAVTVYDSRSMPGGLDTYGMAEYKMTVQASLAEVAQIERLGVRFQLDTAIGKDISFDVLLKAHDAVFLAVGLGAMSTLGIPGEDLPGVMDALDFIERVKLRRWETIPLGKTAAVIGAGNTAVDAATQAKRLGAENVLMLYRRTEAEMPAYEYEYDLAKADAVEFRWKTAPVEVVAGPDGRAAGLRCVEMAPAGKADAKGRMGYVPIPGSEFVLPADLIIKAVGQTKRVPFLATVPGVELDTLGRVVVDEDTMRTGHEKIFAGGDCVNGGREAVDAAQMGKRAARGIHFSLTGERVKIAGLWQHDTEDEATLPAGAPTWGGKL